jgi:hypothetical protein
MKYPLEILPNPNYKVIDNDLEGHYLIRYTNTNDKGEIWNEEINAVNFRQICSPEDHIEDLSTSLLGIYQPHHVFIEFTKDGKAHYMYYCAPDEQVEPPTFEKDYISNPNRHFWCVPIAKLNNRTFTYNRENNEFNATCLVKHTPMKWNYWHFSLRWKTDAGFLENLEERERKKVAKKIGQSARVSIAHFAIITKPQHPHLSSEYYCKQHVPDSEVSQALY